MKTTKRPAPSDELVQLEKFRWAVPQEGYRWVQGSSVKDFPSTKSLAPWAADLYLVQRSSDMKTTTAPLDEALFREFAETPCTQEGVLNFANIHGWLGLLEPFTSPDFSVDSESPKGNSAILGDRLGTWLGEIDAMHHLVRVWNQSVRTHSGVSRRPQKFERSIHFYAGEQIIYHRESHKGVVHEIIASRDMRPELFNRLQGEKDLTKIVRAYFQVAVNDRLVKHSVDDVRLLWNARFDRLGLCIVPGNLIGFLWLQFAKAIEGGIAHRQCESENCGKWFALGGRSGRSDKKFCSGTCKSRQNRAQHKKTTP